MHGLDTGTHASLLDASNFVRTLTERQGLQVGSPDEVAYELEWISKDGLGKRAELFGKNKYGQYLLGLLSMTKNILVTGGAGYIGSHACKALQQAGYVPVTFDNLVTGWQDAVKFGPFEQGDLLNRSDIDRVFEKYAPVAVMHFAALSQVGESMQKPGLYWQNNVMGSLNLIQAAVDHGCMDFVFSSTCATYGDQDNVVLDEHSAQHPINAYGASKRAVENILADFGAAYGLNSVIFRYFNVAGQTPTARLANSINPKRI